MIDIHCHILPEVDDGPQSWEVSMEMCRMAATDGITHIAATPHCNDRYHYDAEYLAHCVRRLQELIGPAPVLTLGCDFHLSYDNLQKVLADPDQYTIRGSRYLLVELSDFSIPTQIGDCFLRLGDLGVTPVITHPERNAILRPNPQRVVEFVELGCAVQITANALTGFWGQRVERAARWLLEHEAVHVIASDAHDTKHRVPVLSPARDAVAALCGAKIAEALVEHNPRAILAGQPLPYSPKPVLKIGISLVIIGRPQSPPFAR
ncbi:MAG TPA: CpsB/CapC family capsule biosynthesis tyrosine phosphatase [Terriglobales bacterium]|nr:CpsB/CapC family capsule biosynthesis tyrosine phosphatase [Terriglobales bacterium]